MAELYSSQKYELDADCSAILRELTDAMANAENVETLSRRILFLLARLTEFENIFLTWIDEEDHSQKVLYSYATKDFALPEGLSTPWDDTLCKRCLSEKLTDVVDVPTHWPDAHVALSFGIHSYLSVPVETGLQNITGTLCAVDRLARALKPEQQALFQMMAKIIGREWEHELLLRRLERENRALQSHAHEDTLTGIANRRALLAELQRTLGNAEREGRSVQLAFIDLDQFKEINDRYGHRAGDTFLRQVAEKLRLCLRQGDFLGRYGGDEFVVFGWASKQAEEGLLAWQTRLESCLQGLYTLDDVQIDYPGASVGTVLSLPNEGADDLLNRADALMYYRKLARRSR